MQAKKYNSTVVKPILKIESRVSKKGDIFFLVEYLDNHAEEHYVTFERMSSVVDFIKSNF